MSKETGGPAFPAGSIRKSRPSHDPGGNFDVTDMVQPANAGMTLRDYFAAMAMQGLLAGEFPCTEMVARDAYLIADEMLKERDR